MFYLSIMQMKNFTERLAPFGEPSGLDGIISPIYVHHLWHIFVLAILSQLSTESTFDVHVKNKLSRVSECKNIL